ncbi:MAG: preprotein translocase subunit YajC [Gammaproteobacteria bacterium]|nr:preprotein translocase subunit YajC [Gammaproteobacteria bacterium]
MFINNAFAQDQSANQTAFSLASFAPLILIFVVLYFVMIRPQMKKQKEMKMMLDSLTTHTEVVTSGGMLGVIQKIEGDVIQLEIAKGLMIQVQRSSVVHVLPKGTVNF